MRRKLKKILYITGTRADFGLMTPILKAIQESSKLDLRLYVTGMHLMSEFGDTFALVRKEFEQAKKINAVFNDSQTGILDFLSVFLRKVNVVLKKECPDFVLTLGDRPEMLAIASACVYAGIATGHVHGGEKTLTNDEIVRHAITKLSHVHFPATATSARRIRKMGEDSWRINVVGAPALDTVLHQLLPSRKELFAYLKIDIGQKIILLTQHPASQDWQCASRQIQLVLQALKKLKLPIVAIYPNSDPGAGEIIRMYQKEKGNSLFRVYPNLEHKIFLALEREAAVWVGNSSAAMIESSSFNIPVVNVGSRQAGRERCRNIIDVGYNVTEIEEAIRKSLYDTKYLKRIKTMLNPWGDGRTGKRVARVLEKLDINSRLLNKQIIY